MTLEVILCGLERGYLNLLVIFKFGSNSFLFMRKVF